MPTSPSRFTETFYTSEKAFENRFVQSSRKMAFPGGDAKAARAWQNKARKRLAELIGLPRFQACPPRPVKVGSVAMDGYTREEWRIQTEANVWMPYYLLVPDGLTAPAPLVLCPHGHSSGGKWSTSGRWDIPEMVDTIKRFNYDYGIQLARQGIITACMDARGFGERREPARQNDRDDMNNFFYSSCHNLTLSGAPLGLTVQGMWTWDLMRLLDFLSEDKRIDTSRIGSAGLSGGGLQTLDLAALDSRVKAAVVSGYFYGVKESLLIKNGNCMCNLVPRMWEDFDMGDIGALIAPRGLFIESGDADPLNGKSGLKNVRSQVGIARKVFQAVDAGDQLKHAVFAGEHRWDGIKAIPWLVKQLAV